LRRCFVTAKADEKYCDCDQRQSDSLVHIGLNEARRVPQRCPPSNGLFANRT
jgi:hypothetical protein